MAFATVAKDFGQEVRINKTRKEIDHGSIQSWKQYPINATLLRNLYIVK